MASSRGFLDRFRTSGTPGAAAGSGVPADRVAERETELAGLFEALAATEAEAQRLRSEGSRRAEEVTAVATERARRLLQDARHDADSDRRAEASRVAALSDEETAATLAAAEADAARIRSHAADVLADYVDRVMTRVHDRLHLPAPEAARGATE